MKNLPEKLQTVNAIFMALMQDNRFLKYNSYSIFIMISDSKHHLFVGFLQCVYSTHFVNEIININCQTTQHRVIILFDILIYLRQTDRYPFNSPLSGTTQVSQYQKGKINLDYTKARDSEWMWHQLGHMQDCTLLQTDNHASNPPLSFLQAGCPSCRPTNSVKALKG